MKVLLFFGAVLWFLATVAGVGYLVKYENTPAEVSAAYPAAFPATSKIERNPDLPILIFFAHPKCPCTRASLRELSRLMTDVDGKLQVYLVFTKPAGEGDEWTQTNLRASAEAIPNVHIIIDENLFETNLFNAQTSGLVLFYDRKGKLRFDGGITDGRGHEGDNAGRTAIFNLITTDNETNAETFVFGCSLHNKDCRGELIQHEQQ